MTPKKQIAFSVMASTACLFMAYDQYADGLGSAIVWLLIAAIHALIIRIEFKVLRQVGTDTPS